MNEILEGETIVYAANDWRTDNRTSAHHIVSYLAAKNRILYLEAAGQRAPRLSKRDLKRAAKRVGKIFQNPVQAQTNLHVYSPFILPFHRFALVRRLNAALLKTSIKRACKRLDFESPIFWFTIPHYAGVLDAFRPKGIVYYCTDDFASFPNTDRAAIQTMENKILSRANIVFVVSEPLLRAKSRHNPHTYLSLHGVDTAHFGKALEADTAVPADIARIAGPIAGFFGLVEEWFDLDLLEHCAADHPDIAFVVIGRTVTDVAALVSRRKNVHFLGPKPYESIPSYLKAFSVGLIPFKSNDTVRYSNPLKFKEYLAGGKPVVSVRIEALEPYAELVDLADSKEEFSAAIRRAIDGDSPEKAARRAAAMGEESWTLKAERISARVRLAIEAGEPALSSSDLSSSSR